MLGITNKKIQQLFMPLGVTVAIVLLLVFGGKFLIGKVGELRDEENLTLSEESRLNEKLNTLKDFSVDGGNYAAQTLLALPAENSALSAISQIRFKSQSASVIANEMTIGKGPTNESNVTEVNVNFKIVGDFHSMLQFVNLLTTTAPVGGVDIIRISSSSDTSTGDLVYKTYYAPLPDTIPARTDPINKLSDEDNQLLQKISQLEAPTVINLSAQGTSARTNPFGI